MFDDDDHPAPVGLEDERAFESTLVDADPAQLAKLEAAADAGAMDAVASAAGGAAGSSVLRKPNWVGKKFGRFKLLRLLGEGSMGRVILAEDVNLHRVTALKILRKRIKGMDGEQAVQQFLREARGASQIDHPNVVRIYEINEYEGWWYIAMELVEGETLSRIVKVAGSLHPGRACPIMADAATALEVAHEFGVIHRDVKPGNLMITRNGRCKLTDFGLVRWDSSHDPFDLQDKSVGTPKYMAPEVIRRQHQGPAIDVYSLGATFYFALTGRPPYVGDKVAQILKQHLEAPPPDVRVVVPGCPDSTAQLIMRMMAKNPEQRPSAAEAADLLQLEAVAFRSDDGSWVQGSSLNMGSSIIQAAIATGSTINIAVGEGETATPIAVEAGQPRATVDPNLSRRPRRLAALAVMVLALIAIVAGVASLFKGPLEKPGVDPAALQRFFPDAPETYGELPAGELPHPSDAQLPAPPFSWRGKQDATDIRFVASKLGRYYFAVESPLSSLIRAEDVVGYRTEEEAQAGGKEKWGR